MMADIRYEYHWLRDGIALREIHRPAGNRRWAYDLKQDSLVCVIEKDGPSFKYREGKKSNGKRLAESIVMYKHGEGIESIADLGKEIPKTLAREVAKKLSGSAASVTEKYDSFARETDMTGHLVGLWEGANGKRGDWELGVKSVTYSPEAKEKVYDADLGVIFELRRRGVRTLKAIWFQAKRSSQRPTDLFGNSQLDRQMSNMLTHSKDSYALVYTEESALSFSADPKGEELQLERLFFDSIVCERGDRRPEFLAVASDCKLVMDVEVTRLV